VITKVFDGSWSTFVASIGSHFTWFTGFLKFPSAFELTIMGFLLSIHVFSENSTEFLLFFIA
jgi:hypothetical protein